MTLPQCHVVKISPQTNMILVVIQKSYNEAKENCNWFNSAC